LSRNNFALKNTLYFKFQIYALLLKYGLNGIKMKNRVTGKEPAFSGERNPSHLKSNSNIYNCVVKRSLGAYSLLIEMV
jgi:hypothetical protein